MEGLWLLLKARHCAPLCAFLVMLAAAVWLVGGHEMLIGERTPIPVPWAAVAPCLGAYAIAGSALPQLVWLDGLAARPVAVLQLAYLAAVSAANGLLLWAATAGLDGDQLGSMAAVRNYAGCLGISLAAVTVVGAELGWIAPVVALFAAIFGTSAAPWLDVVTWMAKPDRNGAALAVAGGYLVLGATLTVSRRLRLRPAGPPLNTLGSLVVAPPPPVNGRMPDQGRRGSWR